MKFEKQIEGAPLSWAHQGWRLLWDSERDRKIRDLYYPRSF